MAITHDGQDERLGGSSRTLGSGAERFGYAEAALDAGMMSGLDLMADLRRVLGALWRHRVLIAVTVLIGALVSTLLAVSLPPQYQATAQVLVGDTETTVLDQQSLVADLYATQIIVEGEAAIIRSRELAEDVIRQSGLLYDPAWNPALAWDASGPETQDAAVARMVAPYYHALSVEPSGRSRVISISFRSASAVQAAAVANAIAQAYLARQVRDKRAANTATVDALRTRVEQLRRDVADREQRLSAFRSANDLPSGDILARVSDRIGLTANQLADERTQLAALRAQHEELRRALKADRLEVPPSLAGAGTLDSLWAQKADLQVKLAQARSIYRPGHPVVERQVAQLEDLKQSIRSEVEILEQNMQAEIATAESRVKTRADVLDDLRKEERRLQDAQVQLSALKRDVDVSRDVLRTFLDREAKLQELQGTEQASSSLVSAAKAPTVPVGPKRMLTLVGGTMAFGFLALLLVLWLEQTDTRLLNTAQALSWTHLPLVGALPEVGAARGLAEVVAHPHEDVPRETTPETLVVDDPDSPFTEAVRSIILALARADSIWPSGVLLVTGADQGEGKTVVAVALARALALDGARVLLVDGNRSAPRLHTVMGLPNTFGLIDHVRDGADVDGIIQGDPLTPLEVIPLGAGASARGWQVGEGGLRSIVAPLAERYDLVVVDGSGAGNNADAAAWAAAADQVVLTLAPGHSRQAHVSEAMRVLRAARAPLAGVVINRSRARW